MTHDWKTKQKGKQKILTESPTARMRPYHVTTPRLLRSVVLQGKDAGLSWESRALVKSLTLLWSLLKVESCSRALPDSLWSGSAVSFYKQSFLVA